MGRILERYLIIPSGEVMLKSKRVRPRLLMLLRRAVEDALARHGKRLVCWSLWESRVFVECDSDCGSVLARVFGVYRVVRVRGMLEGFKTLDDISVWAEKLFREDVKGRKFAVRVKRSGKHGFTSLDVARQVGSRLKPYSSGVDLENPDIEVFLEVRGDKVVGYTGDDIIEGVGGLPAGSEGRALSLFSGGIDTPVATWYVARRGVLVDMLHVVVSSPASAFYAFETAKQLSKEWLYGYRPKMYVVELGRVFLEVQRRVKRSLRMVVLKLIFYMLAARYARKYQYHAIVTGESIGQTSSQTLQNLYTIHAVLEETLSIPVLRPLAGLDKEEITEKARFIGTYEYSARMPEYSALVREGATTRARVEDAVKEFEKIVDVVEEYAGRVVELDLVGDGVEALLQKMPLDIHYIPWDAKVFRVDASYEYPGSQTLPDNHEVRIEHKWQPVVIYSDDPSMAKDVARKLRGLGLNAYALALSSSELRELEESGGARINVEPGGM